MTDAVVSMWHSFGRSRVYFWTILVPKDTQGCLSVRTRVWTCKKVRKTRSKGVFCSPSVCAKPLPLVCILSLNLLIILFVYVSLGQTKGVEGGFSMSWTHWWCPFCSKMSPLAAVSRCHFLAFVWISLPVCGFFVSLVEWMMPLGMYYTINLSN